MWVGGDVQGRGNKGRGKWDYYNKTCNKIYFLKMKKNPFTKSQNIKHSQMPQNLNKIFLWNTNIKFVILSNSASKNVIWFIDT